MLNPAPDSRQTELHVLHIEPPQPVPTGLANDGTASARFATLPVYIVDGKTADNIGGISLQRMAEHLGFPVVVDGPTGFHGRRIFHPTEHQLTAERRLREAITDIVGDPA